MQIFLEILLGAYHPGEDKILIFDVARFKYPPHWLTVEQMWDAMKTIDSFTGEYFRYH